MSWRAIPLALRIAAILTLLVAVIGVVQHQVSHDFAMLIKISMARSAISVAIKGLALFGALELADILPRPAALGARLAAAGWAITLALSVFDLMLSFSQSFAQSAETFVRWTWFLALLAVGVGLAIAAWRKPAIALVGAALWLLTDHPPPLEDWFVKQFADRSTLFLVQLGFHALQGVSVLLLAGAAVGGVPHDFAVREPERLRRGFSGLATSMWIRVLSVSMLPLLALIMTGSRGDNAVKMMTYAIVAAAIINIGSLFVFAWGALEAARSRHLEVSRGPLLVAATAALWCAGLALYQTPEVYQMMTGGRDRFGEDSGIATAFSIVAPFVAAAAVVAATIAISGFANRRQQLDLGTRAHTVGVVFVLLQAANLAVMHWMLPEARSNGSGLMILLLALGCALAGIVMFAKLARDAAALVTDHAPKLPTATML